MKNIEYDVIGIGEDAFGGSGITSVSISDSVTYISDKAFRNCNNLTEIVIPDSVTSIATSVFYSCEKLETVSLSSNIVSIPEYTFSYCSSLKTISMNTITSIGDYAFLECKSLQKIDLPDSLEKIGREAFSDCTSLKDISFPTDLEEIGESAFEGCKALESISLPDDIKVLPFKVFCGCIELKNIDLPANLEEIGNYAFSGCPYTDSLNPKQIVLPDSLKKIGENAFSRLSTGSYPYYYYCKISDIVFPEGLTEIDDNAFYECYFLKNITFKGTEPPSMDGEIFKNIVDLEIFVPEVSKDKYSDKLSLDENAKIIGDPSLNPKKEDPKKDDPKPESPRSKNALSNKSEKQEEEHIHSWTYGIISAPTEDADGLEGEYCSCGATQNTSVISAISYFVENKFKEIEEAGPGEDNVIDLKRNCNLSRSFMKKLAERKDCSFTLRFEYEHTLYEVYIPAGTEFDTTLKWYGPLKLIDMFKWKKIQ